MKCKFLILALFWLVPVFGSSWKVEYWQYFKFVNFQHEPLVLYTTGDFRADQNVSRAYYYRITENLAYHVCPDLTVETHYSFVYDKPLGALAYSKRHRFEFEVNPSFPINEHLKIAFRNRYELIKHENEATWQNVARQRIMALFSFDKGWIKSVNIHNEIFYQFNSHRFSQNRFTPFEIAFRLGEKAQFSLFVMLRNYISSDIWRRSLVVGSRLDF